ncbi:unnamed protein product [Ilex paraguariensis]|uniref:Plastid lipid-associated protein/fibrillin conserved domain-containing protein n=1 Tax=Ilex paraguariensis TaxID=185542 RepID=A0ABC8RLQ6_9AQUA
MDLASASLLYPPTGTRAVGWTKSSVPRLPTPNAARERFTRNRLPYLANVAAQPTKQQVEIELENSKFQLLKAIQDTQRGLVTTADQRSFIEEALVSVESYDAGNPFDFGRLDGTWRLQYTSAPDVLILLESAARLPFFQVGQIFQKFECEDLSDRGYVRNVVQWSIPNLLEVGQIFQKFECEDLSDRGYVRNVVQWSIPNLLEKQEGATLIVSAKFSVVSLRNIYLQFEEKLQCLPRWLYLFFASIGNDIRLLYPCIRLKDRISANRYRDGQVGWDMIAVENIKISEQLQALIVPALLPRTCTNAFSADLAVNPIIQSSSTCKKPSEVYDNLAALQAFHANNDNKLIAGDLQEDYITFHIWIAICFWVVPLVVEYLYLAELKLMYDEEQVQLMV